MHAITFTLKDRLDSFSNIIFYVADATNAFPSPNHFSAKELAGFTSANGLGYSIQNMTSQTANNHEGFIFLSAMATKKCTGTKLVREPNIWDG